MNQEFESKFIPEPNTGCWLWVGCTDEAGYGRFWDKARGKLVSAHRFSFQTLRGEIPKGLVLDHLCRTRSCVNPDHLNPCTQKQNIYAPNSECLAKIQSERLKCPRGHELHPGNLEPSNLAKGKRACLSCVRASQRLRHRGSPGVKDPRHATMADEIYASLVRV